MKINELVKGMKVRTWSGEILTFIAHDDFHAYCLDEEGNAVFVESDKLERIDNAK